MALSLPKRTAIVAQSNARLSHAVLAAQRHSVGRARRAKTASTLLELTIEMVMTLHLYRWRHANG